MIADTGKLIGWGLTKSHDTSVRSGRSLHRSQALGKSHRGSAIPRLSVSEEGPDDQRGCQCHKSWLSRPDFIWLILMSHKVCWILHYDVTWLIVLTWPWTCESLLCYDWLIVSWLTIVTSYDVMSLAHDSYYESWVSRMWLVWAHDLVYEFWLVIGILGNDSYESSMDFALWLTISHRGLCSAGWWVTRVRVVGRCLYKALGSDQEIRSSRNHLSTFLYSRYCNTITLYSLYIPSCSTRTYDSKNLETIVIVLSSTTIHPPYYLKK